MAPGHLKANVRSALGDALLTLCTALSTVLSLPVRWALGPPVFPSHLSSSMSTNVVGIIYKRFPEVDHFSPPLRRNGPSHIISYLGYYFISIPHPLAPI